MLEEEGVGFVRALPGVLGLEDVLLEVVFEDVDASSVVGWVLASQDLRRKCKELGCQRTTGGGAAADGC